MKRYYAVIPDIHGCKEELDAALTWIHSRDDIEKIVTLGDYVDRGSDSKGVIETLIDIDDLNNVFLRGNHDQMMIEYLDNPIAGEQWFHLWGSKTAESFSGIWNDREAMRKYEIFLKQTFYYFETDHHVFVHAGLIKNKKMSEQNLDYLLWGRDMFAYSDYPKIVVTGHSIVPEPMFKNNHLALDCGCFVNKKLTIALVPTDGSTDFIFYDARK